MLPPRLSLICFLYEHPPSGQILVARRVRLYSSTIWSKADEQSQCLDGSC